MKKETEQKIGLIIISVVLFTVFTRLILKHNDYISAAFLFFLIYLAGRILFKKE